MGGVTDNFGGGGGTTRKSRNRNLPGISGFDLAREDANRGVIDEGITAGRGEVRERDGTVTRFRPIGPQLRTERDTPVRAPTTAISPGGQKVDRPAEPAAPAQAPRRPRSSPSDAGTSGRRRRRSATVLTLGLATTTRKKLLGE